jgi:uncharacterized protein (DUF1499 family)
MKKIVLIAAILAVAAVFVLITMGKASRTGQAPGLVDGRLARCPDKPNCICSEYRESSRHFIEPLDIEARDAEDALTRLRTAIIEAGGSIKTERADYIAATFTSAWFGFVDDLEVRLDTETARIHFRSASRVGYSDLDANRKRVESLQRRLRETGAVD